MQLVDVYKFVWTGFSLACCLVIRGLTGSFHLLWFFSGIVSRPRKLQVLLENRKAMIRN